MLKPLPRSFFERDPKTVAQELLGKILVRKLPDTITLTGIISETEAYLGETDPAAHSFHGKTKRTWILYEKAGLAYIHTMHRHNCLDITCEGVNKPGSLLVRGIIPLEGIDIMKKNRGKSGEDIKNLTNGPGKLSQAMNIDMSFYGKDLTDPNSGLFVAYGTISDPQFITTPRIGISKAKEELLRYILRVDNSKTLV